MKEELIKRLYPLNRTLAGDDTDNALEIIKEYLPIEIYKIPSGTQAFTWTIPDRWEVEHAYVKDDSGNTIMDYEDNPLYLASYSDSFNGWVTYDELLAHASTSKVMPDHIPFSYKYYDKDWHISLEYNKVLQLTSERYYVDIKTTFKKEHMSIGEYTLPGSLDETILLICNICHPYQVNDSLVGVATFVSLVRKLEKRKLKYTYKLLICPETIGSIAYLAKFDGLIPKIKYGIFTEMTGIDRPLRLIKTRCGDNKIDKIAEYVLKRCDKELEVFPVFSEPANDEKVLNSPGFDIPAISIVRWPYNEYHTSADDLSIVNYEKVEEAENALNMIIDILEKDYVPIRKYRGYLCFSACGLEKDMRMKDGTWDNVLLNTLISLDNKASLFDIAKKFSMDFNRVYDICETLKNKDLIKKDDNNDMNKVKIEKEFIDGKKVYLRLFCEEDLPIWQSWFNDIDTIKYLCAGRWGTSINSQKKFMEALHTDINQFQMAVVAKEGKQLIGLVKLNHINLIARNADISIVIGEKSCRGQGLAYEALRLLISYGFDYLNLHRITAGSVEENIASLNLFKKLGFKEEGLYREHFYVDGKYFNSIVMGLLRSEYKDS